MAEFMSELKIVDAPAGSGKSTEIKKKVKEWSTQHPHDKLLCVTFTNRAAEELKREISSPNIEVSTIHSFFKKISESLFATQEIVALYFELYGETIKARIENVANNSNIESSNARYREKLGNPLTYEAVVDSIQSLYYNERPFNTLYKGGLCHEDLLSFIGKCAKRYPAIYKRVSSKYQQIIIDEYQDTDVNVLEFFLAAVEDSGSSLHLYGDRMQQIYKSDPTRFQDVIQRFEVEKREVVNFRSTQQIVSVLNRIYNDEHLKQKANSTDSSSNPRVHFTTTPKALEEQLADKSTLVLSVHNSSIFDSFGALDLFRALQAMPDHAFNSRYSAGAVLTEPEWEKVQNPLIRLLYGLLEVEHNFALGNFGSAIKLLRNNHKDFGTFSLALHSDKTHLSEELSSLFTVMCDEEATIKQIISRLAELDVSTPADVREYLEQEEYSLLVEVPFAQVRKSFEFRANPTRSTQHGVKGESHEKVIFIAESTTNSPRVHMKKLFDLWPRFSFSLQELESFLAQMSRAFREATENIGEDVSKLKAPTFGPVKDRTTQEARTIEAKYNSSPLFSELYAEIYAKYIASPGVTNAQKLFKLTPVEGLLAAYRLFYVGCSRAKFELDVIISHKEVSDISVSAAKFKDLGFDVVIHPQVYLVQR